LLVFCPKFGWLFRGKKQAQKVAFLSGQNWVFFGMENWAFFEWKKVGEKSEKHA